MEWVYALTEANAEWFLAAAWDFDMLLDFARVESMRAAHLFIFGVAWCVQWSCCEERAPARSSSAALESIAVLSLLACVSRCVRRSLVAVGLMLRRWTQG